MHLPWQQLPDFDSSVGDIKGVWEASRFDWVLSLAKDAARGGVEALPELNGLCADWIEKNPPYLGPNWKCGQEASIRVMHLAFAAKILNQVSDTEKPLLSFIKAHLQRIAPTISYAVAQDNNHGTSEAAALFIGGSWLVANGDTAGLKWQKMGRKWLENRAIHLIEPDGTFSQYSVNYHRVMLDTFSMAELWREELKLSVFSDALYDRLRAATSWLYQLVQEKNGDAPNLGHNDGANLFRLSSCDYRDFRPSVQLAALVFWQSTAWEEKGAYDEPPLCLGLEKPRAMMPKPKSFHFVNGGYFGLRKSNGAFVFMTYPKFRFRPAQCDALHLDFWFKGDNLLRDGGTFSYNAGEEYIAYYGGTQSHNTVQFDDHEQMPRLSRFLLGAWVKAKDIIWDNDESYFQASYEDYLGCTHGRKVNLLDDTLRVVDQLDGFQRKALLRWRLKPGDWTLVGNVISNGVHAIKITADTNIKRLELVDGKESRYYYQETIIPVIEIELASSGAITTEYNYK